MMPPILFLVFNRPETTRAVFDVIRSVRPEKLYIAADGARSGRMGEAKLCDDVRQIVSQIDWECRVEKLFRSENLGCKRAVSEAISWFFEREEYGIIIEDDVVPCPSFFEFMSYALSKYEDDLRVMMVCGSNSLGGGISSSRYFFSTIGSVWGWGTWRRAWLRYDSELPDWSYDGFLDNLSVRFGRSRARYLAEIFAHHNKLQVDTWDTQWTYCCVFNSGYAVIPEANLVSNIGVVGTHSSQVSRNHFVPLGSTKGGFSPPETVWPDYQMENAMDAIVYQPFLKRVFLIGILRKMGIYGIVKSLMRR